MRDATFDALVGGFYRAATGETTWDHALDGVSDAFGARCVMLHTADLRNGRIHSLHQGGAPMKEQMLDYITTYHTCDPRRHKLLEAAPSLMGRWWHCHEHIPEEVVARDRFHQQFLPSLNVRYQSTLVLSPGEQLGTAFAIELPRQRGVLDADEREVARRLGVHLNDALRAYQRVRLLAAQALAGHQLLSSFPYAMWLLDFDRYVHFENRAAASEIALGQRLDKLGQALKVRRSRADTELTIALHKLRDADHGATEILPLRDAGLDVSTWLHLSVIVPQAVFGAFGERPLVLATLFDPQAVSALNPFAVGRLFGLTPAQSRVAVKLADGMTAKEIAEDCGCTVATVRTHVREVLARLGAQRITDVVRVLRQGQSLWSQDAND